MSSSDPQYVLCCNKCYYKRYTNGTDLSDLIEVKTLDLQRHLPIYDQKIKKTIVQTTKKRPKIFRCPKCGFSIKAFKVVRNEDEQTDRTD